MHDVMPIVNEAFRLTAEELEEVQEYVDLGDLLRLLKRLLRNGRNIEKMLDQLESMMDLVQTVGPLTDQRVRESHRSVANRRAQGLLRLRPRRHADRR